MLWNDEINLFGISITSNVFFLFVCVCMSRIFTIYSEIFKGMGGDATG